MKNIRTLLYNENAISIFLALVSFCVYTTTMCHSVGFTDTGELAVVACTLGIAHPTGYPLFTLLGRCWIMIPSILEEIVRLNLFVAVITATAVGVFFKTSLVIHRSVVVFQQKYKKRNGSYENRFMFAAANASLILGFSTTFWSQSTALEVYALHLVLLLSTLWMFVRGLEEELTEPSTISRKFILFAFILGLSFSNHMTTILMAPGFLWLYFRTFGLYRESFQRIFKLSIFFILGLSVYFYLPLRSAHHPVLDWGHPAELESFFWHVSGKQFRVWMFSGWGVVQKQFIYYVGNFTSEFSFFTIACIILGIAALFRESRRLLIFLVLLFGSTIAYAVNYDIFDIDSYFLLSYLVAGFLIAYGIFFIIERIKESQLWVKRILVFLCCVFPIIQIVQNWERVNESENRIPQQFIEKAFSDLEPHAVVLASAWDYFISPSLYYQWIRHERNDVTIIDESLLQNHSWYFLQLERHASWLLKRIQPSSQLFLIELNKFEHDEPFHFTVIQSQWRYLLSQIVEQSLPDHPVYIDPRLDQEFSQEYHRIPAGLFLRLVKNEDTTYYHPAMAHFTAWKNDQPVAKDFTRYYCTMLMRDAYWLAKHREMDGAKKAVQEVLHHDPGNYEAQWFVTQISKGE